MSETLKKLEELEQPKKTEDELIIIEPEAGEVVARAVDAAPSASSPARPAEPAIQLEVETAGPARSSPSPFSEAAPQPSNADALVELEIPSGTIETIIDLERPASPAGSSHSREGISHQAPATGMLHLLQHQRRELLRRGQSLRDEVIRSRILGRAANASPRMKKAIFSLAALTFIVATAIIARDIARRIRNSGNGPAATQAQNGGTPAVGDLRIPGFNDGEQKKELTWEDRYLAAVADSQRGNIDGAVVQLRTLLEERPNDLSVPTSLSLIFQRMQKWTDAQRVLIEAQARNPGSGLPYNNLGMIALRQGQLPVATKLLEKSVQLDIKESRGEPLINLARAYELTSQWQKAKMTYEKFLIFPSRDERYISLIEDRIKKLEPFAANQDSIEEQKIRTIVRRPAEEPEDTVIDDENPQDDAADGAGGAGGSE